DHPVRRDAALQSRRGQPLPPRRATRPTYRAWAGARRRQPPPRQPAIARYAAPWYAHHGPRVTAPGAHSVPSLPPSAAQWLPVSPDRTGPRAAPGVGTRSPARDLAVAP